MGARGKIEAVIYAAEEPVTLAQLAALFGDEAVAEHAATEAPTEAPASPELDKPGLPAVPEPLEETEAVEAMGAVSREAASESATASATVSAVQPDVDRPGEPDDVEEAEKRGLRLRERARREAVRAVLDALMAEYDRSDRGMEIREIAGGFRVATKPEYHDAVRGFVKSLKPPMKLTLPALETLAVIAYKQPVTAPEVSEIRGVDSGGVLGSLVGRKLVTTAGRKQVVGRPILYKTTREFLLRFGLKDLTELPSMEEFEKMAGELASMGEEPLQSDPGTESESASAPSAPTEVFNMAEMEDKTSEASSGEGTSLGERPRLEPLMIAVDVEEVEASGVSVDRSGNLVEDAAHGSGPPAGDNEEQDG